MHSTSPVKKFFALFRREWHWIFTAPLFVISVLIYNMQTNIGSDYEVLNYEPHSILTLLLIDHMHQQSGWLPSTLPPTDPIRGVPEELQSAHGALLFVWLMSRFLPSAFLILLASYFASAFASTALAYIALRVTRCAPRWAWVGSIAFGLMPARFWWPDWMTHWFLLVPLISACIGALWYYPHLWNWQQWVWYDWLVIIGIVIIATAFGKSSAYMAVLAIVIAVGVYGIETSQWKHSRPLLCVGGAIWMFTTLFVWWLPDAQPAFARDFRGVLLTDLIIPHAQHTLSTLATTGGQYSVLQIQRTYTMYLGILAVFGLVVIFVNGVMHLANVSNLSFPKRSIALILTLLLIANQKSIGLFLVWLQVTPFVQWEHASIWVLLWSLQASVTWMQQRFADQHRAQIVLLILLTGLIVLDQVPQTTIIKQMPQTVKSVGSTTWRQGVYFSQEELPLDVESITGLTRMNQGEGSWANPDSSTITVNVSKPISTPLTLHIRAKTIPEYAGIEVPIQVGGEIQTVLLTSTIQEHVLEYTQISVSAQQIVIHVPPLQHADPNIGIVFVQSLWATAPNNEKVNLR